MNENVGLLEAPVRGAVPVYLYPGRIFTTSELYAVTTVLGSCVSVCLWDGPRRLAGINHFLLPEGPPGATSWERFGRPAVEGLIGELLRLGSEKCDLVAKVFGGSRILGTSEVADRGKLGDRNVELARSVLAAHEIPVVAEDVGGPRGRKLIFNTSDGSVRVKML